MLSVLIQVIRWFRQPVSGLSHLVGAILGLVGLAWMLLEREGEFSRRIPFLVFGGTLVLLFLSSALYHLLPLSEKGIARLRKLDHSAIYVFIAGCYTPFCLNLLGDGKGPTVLGVVWAMALLGVATKLFWMESSRWLRVGMYVGLSAVSVVILPEIWTRLPSGGLAWLFGGGASYGIGALVYASKWPDPLPEVFGFHECWHLFVLGGAFCHFWVVTGYLLPLAS